MTVTKTGRTTTTQNEIVEIRDLSPDVKLFKVFRPDVAKAVKPGQFVVFRADDYAERIPLTVADADSETGLVTVIFQTVGASTRKLALLAEGDTLMDVVGPLGKLSEIEMFGTVVCIGGGIGVAPVYPIAQALQQRGERKPFRRQASCKCSLAQSELLGNVGRCCLAVRQQRCDRVFYGRLERAALSFPMSESVLAI